MKKTGLRLLVGMATIIICLLVLDLGLRAIGRSPSNVTNGFFIQNGDSYRLKKNLQKTINWPAFSYVAYTNEFGARDRIRGEKKLEDRKYVVFLGDSATFGNGVDYEDSFVGVFDRLSDSIGIEVVNLAVGGHHFPDQVDVLHEFMDSVTQKPLAVFICVNPNFILTFDRRTNHIVVKNGYLFPKSNWLLPYFKVMVGNTSAAYCFFRDSIRTTLTKNVSASQEKLSSYMQLYCYNNPKVMNVTGGSKFYNFLDTLVQYCRSIEAEPIFVYLPLTVDFQLDKLVSDSVNDLKDCDLGLYTQIIRNYSGERSCPYIDLTEVLQRRYESGNSLRFELDGHYNIVTNHVVGQHIYNETRIHVSWLGTEVDSVLP